MVPNRILATVALCLSIAGTARAACTTPSLQHYWDAWPEHEGYRATVGDVNRDGRVDLISHSGSSASDPDGVKFTNDVRVSYGYQGYYTNFQSYKVPSAQMSTIADVNGDRWPDLVVAHAGKNVGVLLNRGDGTFHPFSGSTDFNLNQVSGLWAGDFDNDGDDDVILHHLGIPAVKILWSNGAGTFTATAFNSTIGMPQTALAHDFNGDGRTDLATAAANGASGNRVNIHLGTAGNTLSETPTFSYNFGATTTSMDLEKGDFNNDGRTDLVVSHPNGIRVLLGKPDGSFTLAGERAAGIDTVFAIAAADLNEDGNEDVALFRTNAQSASIDIVMGDGTGQFTGETFHQPTPGAHNYGGWAADLDEDGRPDLIAYESINVFSLFRNTCAKQYAKATVTGGPNPSQLGSTVRLTATLAQRGGWYPPTGNVQLFIDDVLHSTKPLMAYTVSSFATFDVTPGAGSHKIRIEYGGDSRFGPATGRGADQVVDGPPYGPPGSFTASRYGSDIRLTWSLVSSATEYEVFRMNAGSWMLLGATAAPSFVDSTVPSATPHVYAVRAKGTGLAPTALSTPDVANVFNFTTNAATNASILATHLTDLRTLVNGLRANVGLPAVTFTDPTLSAGVPVRAAHITELRSALAAAFTAAGIATPAYTQPTLTPGTTKMKAADLLELRNALQ